MNADLISFDLIAIGIYCNTVHRIVWVIAKKSDHAMSPWRDFLLCSCFPYFICMFYSPENNIPSFRVSWYCTCDGWEAICIHDGILSVHKFCHFLLEFKMNIWENKKTYCMQPWAVIGMGLVVLNHRTSSL
jgi:hypothetical protein